MASKTTKTVIIVGSVVVAAGIIGYVIWKAFQPNKDGSSTNTNTNTSTDTGTSGGSTSGGTTGGSGKGSTSTTSNPIPQLRANLGLSLGDKDFSFLTEGKTKNNNFYKNGRFLITDAKTGAMLVKGSYSNGGLTLTADNGKVAQSGSVFKNLQDIIR